MQIPFASIVLPSLNSKADLSLQISALMQQEAAYPFELIISDNGSTDGTREMVLALRETDPRIHYVFSGDKPGTNHARNVGVRAATGELIIFCDADDIVAAGWVSAYIDAYLKNPSGIFGGVLLRFFKDQVVETSGLNQSLWNLNFAAGANCAVSRSVFNDVGLFDESWQFEGEDADFFWTAQLLGKELTFVPDAKVAYRLRTTTRAMLKQRFRWGVSNARLYDKYRRFGMPPSKPLKAISACMISLFWVFLGEDYKRLEAAGRIALHCGRVSGSLRFGVLYL